MKYITKKVSFGLRGKLKKKKKVLRVNVMMQIELETLSIRPYIIKRPKRKLSMEPMDKIEVILMA